MLKIKEIKLKNFMSCGNKEQSISFQRDGLTLILGENMEFGGGASRNGVGKSTILQALHFALYGIAIENRIKKDNLVNKTNGRNLMVSVDFEKDGSTYRIVRTRKPASLQWIVNNNIVNNEDEAEGDSRATQEEIQRVLGLSSTMFSNIIALNTNTTPFLQQPIAKQRDFIEELLGIVLLSEKADLLKTKNKETVSLKKDEETKIKAINEANSHIQITIDNLHQKSKNWYASHNKKISELQEKLIELDKFDIDSEIKKHNKLEKYKEANSNYQIFDKEVSTYEKSIQAHNRLQNKLSSQLEKARDHKCYTCGQDVHNEQNEHQISELEEELHKTKLELESIVPEYEKSLKQRETYKKELIEIGDKPKTFYKKVEEAWNHRNLVEKYADTLESALKEENPYQPEAEELEKNGLQKISYEKINNLVKIQEHQEFLLKLLTNKDSFIRKKIIDQNLGYLNNRLEGYLEKLGLTHQVKFLNDLSVEITKLGQDFDFDSLSKGEKRRLMLALSKSFRDIWESMNTSINILMVDEILDDGLDTSGVESALELLKKITREKKKNVFLISHREELISRVGNILIVRKENGFTEFDPDPELEKE